MPVENLGLQRQPFHKTSQPTTFVVSQSSQDGLQLLRKALDDERGIGFIHGPALSGKSVLANRFVRETQSTMAVASVDGEGLYASQLLSKILEQFGYDIALNSTDELLNMINVFLVQQTRTVQPPLLVVDNVHRMYPGALNALCKLARVRARDRFALRMVLLGQGNCKRIIQSPSMRPIAERLCQDIVLAPLSIRESMRYLHEKLRQAGAPRPDDIFPANICDVLHEASGGIPGKLDSIAAAVLDQSAGLPIRLENVTHPDLQVDDGASPRLVVTHDGAVVEDCRLLATRVLIGRSELSDILIADHFVSKQHALLIWENESLMLIDLNSANGTLVNSVRVKSRVLRDNDIISMGSHRIKLIYAKAGTRTDFEDPDLADTATMKNIAEARRSRAIQRLPLKVVDQVATLRR